MKYYNIMGGGKLSKILNVIVNILLAASICFASVWIGRSIEQVGKQLSVPSLTEKGLLSRGEAAEYLSLPEGEFYALLKNIEIENQPGKENWDERRMLRSVSIHGLDYFSRKELDRWIDYNINSVTD